MYVYAYDGIAQQLDFICHTTDKVTRSCFNFCSRYSLSSYFFPIYLLQSNLTFYGFETRFSSRRKYCCSNASSTLTTAGPRQRCFRIWKNKRDNNISWMQYAIGMPGNSFVWYTSMFAMELRSNWILFVIQQIKLHVLVSISVIDIFCRGARMLSAQLFRTLCESLYHFSKFVVV